MHWRSSFVNLLVALLWASACRDEEVRPRDEETSCAALDFDACQARSKCKLLYGRPLDETARCLGDITPFECKDRPNGCDDTLGYVRDGMGRIWQFGNSNRECLPSDLPVLGEDADHPWGSWPLCRPEPATPNENCSAVSTSSCESELGCAGIYGQPFDPARRCRYREAILIGCRQADASCPPAVVHVGFPSSSEAFEVASGCIPAKFERLDYRGDAIGTLPLCN